MDKEEALIEFLKGLRIVINNASAYPKEHPYFIKSVDNFKEKLDTILPFLNPIKIDITPDSLFIDGKYWQNLPLYVDLASMLHLRKIKSVEFRAGISTGELIDFLSSVSLPIREILKKGGIQKVLNLEKAAHLAVGELDYSELLKDAGGQLKDIWGYLFREAVEEQDQQKIDKLVNNFGEVIAKFKTKELSEDGELRDNIGNFLNHLKAKEKEKFYQCTQGLLKALIRDKTTCPPEDLGKLNLFFKDLDKDDLAQTLFDEISRNEDFNYLTFTLFARLFEEEKNRQIAASLENKIKSAPSLKNNPRIRKEIKKLFFMPEAPSISTLYLKALKWLSEDMPLENDLAFNHQAVETNYSFLLLNLLKEEKDKKDLGLISERLLSELPRITQQKDLGYPKLLAQVLDKRIKEDPSLAPIFEGPQRQISDFVEDTAFAGEPSSGLDDLIDTLSESWRSGDFYFNKIFKEGRVNSSVLKLLLKFFPEQLPYIYEELQLKHSDIDFMAKVTRGLGEANSPLSLEVLKHIFYSFNNLIKIEVLRATQNLPGCDEFLLSALKDKEVRIKKEALAVILNREEKIKEQAAAWLLSVPNRWGKNNKLIMENIMIVEELGLREADLYLLGLSKKRFFWNKKIRDKSSSVLENWHGRKD